MNILLATTESLGAFKNRPRRSGEEGGIFQGYETAYPYVLHYPAHIPGQRHGGSQPGCHTAPRRKQPGS